MLVKQSCPFIYSWDGEKYVFDAEPYGGAITRGLERDDYSELEHLREQNSQYRLLLTNEVDETQYTNLVELWVADHPGGARVVSDDSGTLYALGAIQSLASATDRAGRDLRPWLSATDRIIWEPAALAGPHGETRDDIVLTFPKPEGAAHANLVVNAGTGLWGSSMIKEMTELRGRDTAAWLASLDADPGAVQQIHAWSLREELYALKVYVEEPDGWKWRGVHLGGGPFLVEDRVVPLDISRVRGDQLRVRIAPPVGFWALNSFAVDYSVPQALEVTRIAPRTGRSDGRDIRPELVASDARYYSMPQVGDRAELVFDAPPPHPGMTRSVFLHSRGWYSLHLRAKGKPETQLIEQVTNVPDGAVRFAIERFLQWQRSSVSPHLAPPRTGRSP
jgi:hypothetical protein